jgi:hypothetical protein
MPRRPGVLLLSAVAIGLLVGAARRRAVTPSLPPAVQYLGFYAGGSTPEINAAPATLQTKAQIEASWAPIINAIGEKGDGVHQQLGFWIGPLGWDLTDAQEKQLIDDAFAIAEKQNVAVGFHIDDSMFWNRRTDLWSDTNNVEWSDWKGTVVPHRIVGWVLDGKPVLAPPMCYNSPAIVKEATRLATDVIGAEIKKNVDHLNSIGKGYLFMGVIAGWETQMQGGVYGYCALTNLGYSASSPTTDRNKALVGIVHDWITLWTKNLSQAGITTQKIFTHIGSLGCTTPPKLPPGITLPADFDIVQFKCGSADPNVVEFTPYSNPGFTLGPKSFLSTSVYTILSAHGSPPWGISESDMTFTGANGVATADDNMEQYLGGVFNHGGVYVDIFGWGGRDSSGALSPFAQADEAPSSIAAYQKFLRGDVLSEQ